MKDYVQATPQANMMKAMHLLTHFFMHDAYFFLKIRNFIDMQKHCVCRLTVLRGYTLRISTNHQKNFFINFLWPQA
jgi:hypothetical protein